MRVKTLAEMVKKKKQMAAEAAQAAGQATEEATEAAAEEEAAEVVALTVGVAANAVPPTTPALLLCRPFGVMSRFLV